MSYTVFLGQKILYYRRLHKLTQSALAKKLGVTPQAVGKWERRLCYPDISLLPELAFIFDVTVDELLGYDRHTRQTV